LTGSSRNERVIFRPLIIVVWLCPQHVL
jgi:hypothetical protein